MREDTRVASGAACQLCPVCALLRAIGGTQPEVVDHLEFAARELALALRATLDAHVDGHGRTADGRADGDRLERIRID